MLVPILLGLAAFFYLNDDKASQPSSVAVNIMGGVDPAASSTAPTYGTQGRSSLATPPSVSPILALPTSSEKINSGVAGLPSPPPPSLLAIPFATTVPSIQASLLPGNQVAQTIPTNPVALP